MPLEDYLKFRNKKGKYKMNEKEQLYYLIDGLLNGNYNIKDFCDEFTRIYNLEIDYDVLSSAEYKCFSELSQMAARFSEYDEDLKIPNVYCSEDEIRDKTKNIEYTLHHSK